MGHHLKTVLVFFIGFLNVYVSAQITNIDNEPCYPGNAWLSCLLDPCRFSPKCKVFPTAQCFSYRTRCNGCKALWIVDGHMVNCSRSTAGTKVCPGGEPVIECRVNSCAKLCDHPQFAKAECRQNNCGGCTAEYLVEGQWRMCPSTDLSIQFDTVVRAMSSGLVQAEAPCAQGQARVMCTQDVCLGQTCPNFPNAECRPNGCGGCRSEWYVGSQLVDCFASTCPPGVPEVTCVDDPCKYFGPSCPNHKEAVCRASNCGSCKAKFYLNGTEVKCFLPARQCPVGVTRATCPPSTCPSLLCGSNFQAMCRVNNCGGCNFEFVHILTNEVVTCREWGKFAPNDTTRLPAAAAPKREVVFLPSDPLVAAVEGVPVPDLSNQPRFEMPPGNGTSGGIPISPPPVVPPTQPAIIEVASNVQKTTVSPGNVEIPQLPDVLNNQGQILPVGQPIVRTPAVSAPFTTKTPTLPNQGIVPVVSSGTRINSQGPNPSNPASRSRSS
ncbi:hypothetical protein ACJMK2_027178 [Sinanodonta woodiana]|uniref:Uncharacterized protein n=1 Tax=Sinanodonta woodiana TaxID=1069815 RepID=A0ABD3XNM9_SINWO